MEYIFFGTPDFAAIILEKLIKAGMPPVAVVCNPDRPVGRKKIITPPPSKVLAEKHGIKTYQPEKLGIDDLWSKIAEMDFAVVAAYAKIIPKEILEIPRLGTIGVHPSLLPKYRGSSPIQSVILNGESETGVTLFLADEKVDHGKIVASIKYKVSNDETYETLVKKLAELGGDLLVETLPKFLKGEINPLPQDESQATYTKKFINEDGYVDLEKDKPEIIERKIRALNPEPGVWTMINNKRTKLLEAKLIDGKLKITKIQIEGKKPQFV
ncbi:MAG: methionyl-tRNA formyltransferase [Candidatus Paceibacterota bacterium]